MSSLKAYIVRDDYSDDGRCCVTFARQAVVARREGANQIDSDFETVECRRAPQFDSFAPGPVPVLKLLDAGWWFECAGCGVTIDSDCEAEGEAGNPIRLEPVEFGHDSACCTKACMDRYLAKRAETKRRQIAAIADMVEFACRKWRGILLEGRPHAYVTHQSDRDYAWWSYPEVDIYFSFPGQRHGKVRLRRDRKGFLELLVPSGDLEAWRVWEANNNILTAACRATAAREAA